MITEEMLRIAAAEADQAIRDSLPHPADCDHQFSPRFERKMKRVIRRGRHPVAYKFLHRAACLLVVVLRPATVSKTCGRRFTCWTAVYGCVGRWAHIVTGTSSPASATARPSSATTRRRAVSR